MEGKLQKYVLGFLFSEDKEFVVLIKKEKPDWQKGCLNGVGGKVEEGERPSKAITREFLEETGVLIEDWEYIGSLSGENFTVYTYRAFDNKAFYATTKESEEVNIFKIEDVCRYDRIGNIDSLLSLAINKDYKNFILSYI